MNRDLRAKPKEIERDLNIASIRSYRRYYIEILANVRTPATTPTTRANIFVGFIISMKQPQRPFIKPSCCEASYILHQDSSWILDYFAKSVLAMQNSTNPNSRYNGAIEKTEEPSTFF